MAQAYSDPTRESDPHALPDIEVFYLAKENVHSAGDESAEYFSAAHEPGWYWWSCFPGCLPDSDPNGPFATEAEALADAQDVD